MAVFDPDSRYVRFASVYTATDRRGRSVQALTAALVPPQTTLGQHQRRDGQRLDHLAAFYLGDANGFWRIAEANGAVLPDALAGARILTIPTPR
ncbi:hypothetical protein [Limobrevibacterium gyesilva]|uniref:LysM domain-containing protein n=1 Tax=Limobrevibacterium gyesilva TaxID=2991712 RepID=A0AA41YNF9_9PROT|nr:hypothetical protein [Limobrevibacterium gyesilva]MCW3475303.1 hypothetical protein [Limobrevibacterium gyesilva]